MFGVQRVFLRAPSAGASGSRHAPICANGLHQTAALLGAKRKTLTSKMGNKNYYKGKGGKPMGRHTKKGGYIIEKYRKPDYIVPDLTDFQVRCDTHKWPSAAIVFASNLRD